jgi:2-polyprenyl-3-methyl-5-hydroxy-6-metoxy-1,4-benzoquinol methylase
MSTSSLDSVRQRFEREAQSFDAIYRLERSPFSRWFNKTFRKAVFERYALTFAHAGDVEGKSVLDVGCGSGVYSVDFARRGAGRVVGVDFSAGMLSLARKEAEEYAVADVCQFIQANFLDLSFPEPFDVSIAMGVFDYLPDPLTFLRKMAAATTGKVIASFPGHSPVRERLRRLRYRVGRKGDVYFYSEADVRRLATEAGFARFSLVPVRSSGTGFVLVGEC